MRHDERMREPGRPRPCRQRHAINFPRTAVRPHLLVGVPDQTLRNLEWLCLRHRLLPSLVDRHLRLESRVPSLHPHYRASSLIRTRPPLCSASVLGSSRVCRLEVSLGIGAPGSHVPHKSLSLVSRRLHAGRRSASQSGPEPVARPRSRRGVCEGGHPSPVLFGKSKGSPCFHRGRQLDVPAIASVASIRLPGNQCEDCFRSLLARSDSVCRVRRDGHGDRSSH